MKANPFQLLKLEHRRMMCSENADVNPFKLLRAEASCPTGCLAAFSFKNLVNFQVSELPKMRILAYISLAYLRWLILKIVLSSRMELQQELTGCPLLHSFSWNRGLSYPIALLNL